MKKKTRFIALALVAVLVLALTPVVANAASNWTKRQEQAHALADGARAMGYGEDSAAIKVMQDIFALEEGDTSVTDSYYYSGRTKQYYKLNVASGTINSDGSYFDGTYFWYLNENTGYYYRFDKWGNRITGEKAKNYETYAGKKLWAGIITDVDNYVSTSEAQTVARFILSYANLTDGSVEQRAELAWCLLNCKGGGDMSTALKKFEDYDKDADLTTATGKEALQIAKDVLFRKYVETYSSNKNVGRVLPKTHSWMWIQDGKVYLRPSKDGANWDHSLASPY
ncbi:hypothetical protein IJQ51_01635 [Candidatus Saccharibacteria bacterium]|nr:hypothetical protein [Candidatus Saccharibacteria bacterium]